jgi:hypothetical protein
MKSPDLPRGLSSGKSRAREVKLHRRNVDESNVGSKLHEIKRKAAWPRSDIEHMHRGMDILRNEVSMNRVLDATL